MPLCLGLPGERPALPREAGEEAPLPATVLDRASLGLSFSVASRGALGLGMGQGVGVSAGPCWGRAPSSVTAKWPHLSGSACASRACCHWARGPALPLRPVVCWSFCHIATAGPAETWKDSWSSSSSCSGVATRLRWPRLSFCRWTVMVPAEHTGGVGKPEGIARVGRHPAE